MTITIPPEAVEAAAVMLSNGKTTAQAIRAALEAWPGMGPIRVNQPIGDWCDKLPALILPLPQEPSDG